MTCEIPTLSCGISLHGGPHSHGTGVHASACGYQGPRFSCHLGDLNLSHKLILHSRLCTYRIHPPVPLSPHFSVGIQHTMSRKQYFSCCSSGSDSCLFQIWLDRVGILGVHNLPHSKGLILSAALSAPGHSSQLS